MTIATVGLLDEYFKAWETQDMLAIAELFSGDADYIVVGKTSLRGVAAIRDYWRDNALRHRSITCNANRIISASDSMIVAEWSSSFYSDVEARQFALAGIIVLEIKDGKIQRLVESYRNTLAIAPGRHVG